LEPRVSDNGAQPGVNGVSVFIPLSSFGRTGSVEERGKGERRAHTARATPLLRWVFEIWRGRFGVAGAQRKLSAFKFVHRQLLYVLAQSDFVLFALFACAMRGRYKRRVVIAALVAVILIALLTLSSRPPATVSAIATAFLGYTNAPDSTTRFALFSVSNQAPYTVRWYGDSVEVEGVPSYHTGPTVHPNLPGFTRPPVLKAGRSIMMAVGEPYSQPAVPDTDRWRFAMSFSRYTWRAWWVDQAFRGRLPLGVGPVVLVDARRILNPTNHVIVTTAWLTK
jgi:hypothetical protein